MSNYVEQKKLTVVFFGALFVTLTLLFVIFKKDYNAWASHQPDNIELDTIQGVSLFADVPDEHLDTDPTETVEASVIPATNAKKKTAKADLFRIVMLETKRREALGRKGAELKPYDDAGMLAIGYGCRIAYLSPEWKNTVRKQKNKITEDQARLMMYDQFKRLDIEIKSDLPNLSDAQRWAVKSMAYTCGYGSLKKSQLFRQYIRHGKTGKEVAALWIRTKAPTDNIRQSRKLEAALWNGDLKSAEKIARTAYDHIKSRGDFAHYN